MTTIHRCTECRARFELPPGKDRKTCRRCSGLVCPGCGGPTTGGQLCSRRPACERKRKRLEREARPRLVRRAG